MTLVVQALPRIVPGLRVPPPLAVWLADWSTIAFAPPPPPHPGPSDELWIMTSGLPSPAAPGTPSPAVVRRTGLCRCQLGPRGLGTALWAHILAQESPSPMLSSRICGLMSWVREDRECGVFLFRGLVPTRSTDPTEKRDRTYAVKNGLGERRSPRGNATSLVCRLLPPSFVSIPPAPGLPALSLLPRPSRLCSSRHLSPESLPPPPLTC